VLLEKARPDRRARDRCHEKAWTGVTEGTFPADFKKIVESTKKVTSVTKVQTRPG
jgi:hypothetical protein